AYGRGVELQDDIDKKGRSTASIRSSVVDRSHDEGIFVLGSDATIESTIVRDTAERVSDGTHGEGVLVQERIETRAPATAIVRASRIEHNRGTGLFATSATGSVETTYVTSTQPWIDGAFGDGIGVFGYDLVAHLDVSGCRIEAGSRAGFSVFAADATLA